MAPTTQPPNFDSDPNNLKQYYDQILDFLHDSLERAKKKNKESVDIPDITNLEQYQNVDLTSIETNYQRIGAKTIINYRGPQFRFLEWANETDEINSIYPWVVTARRAILFLKMSLQRHNRFGVPVGKSTRDCEIAAIVDLFCIQKSFITNYPDLSDPEEPKLDLWPDFLRDSAIRHYLQAKKNTDRDVQQITGQDKVSRALSEGYTQDQLLELAKVTLSDKGPNLWFCMISSQSLMFRGDSVRRLVLSDVFLKTLENGPNGRKRAMYFATHHNRINRTGRALYSGALRHKNPLLCTHSALAFNFFRRFHTKRNRKSEPPIDFSSPRNYYYIKLFRGMSPTKSLSANRAETLIRTQLRKVGLFGQKITQIFRGSAARHCIELGATEESVRIFGHWGRQSVADNYLAAVPETPMHILAGFHKDELYFIDRDRSDPPESLCRKIFPFINLYLDAFNNGTLDSMLASVKEGILNVSEKDSNGSLEINNNTPVPTENPPISDASRNPENTGPIDYFNDDDDETGNVTHNEMTDEENESTSPINNDSDLRQEPQPNVSTNSGPNNGLNDGTSYNDAARVGDAVVLIDYLRRILIQDFDFVKEYLPEEISSHSIFKTAEYNTFLKQQRQVLSEPLSLEFQERLDNPKTYDTVCSIAQTVQATHRCMVGGLERIERIERMLNTQAETMKSFSQSLKILTNITEALGASVAAGVAHAKNARNARNGTVSNDNVTNLLTQLQAQISASPVEAENSTPLPGFEAHLCTNIREYIDDYHALEAKRVELFAETGQTNVRNISNFRKYQRRKRIYNVAANLVKAGKTMDEAIDILQEDFKNSNKSLDAYSDLKKDELLQKYNALSN